MRIRRRQAGAARLEHIGRPIVLPAQHDDVAKALGDGKLRGAIGRGGAAVGDVILLLGDFQRIPRTGLSGRLQSVRQRPLAAAGGIEVVGQIEYSVRRAGLQRECDAMVQFLTPLGG